MTLIGQTLLYVILIALAISFFAAVFAKTAYLTSIVLIGAGVYLVITGFKFYGEISLEYFNSLIIRMGVAVYTIVVFTPPAIEYLTLPQSGRLVVFEFRRNFIVQAVAGLVSTFLGVFLLRAWAINRYSTVGLKPFGFFGLIAALGGIVDLIPSTAIVIKFFDSNV